VVANDIFRGTKFLSASTVLHRTTVWGLNALKQLFYVFCPAGRESDHSSWPYPVPICTSVKDFTFYLNLDAADRLFLAGEPRRLNVITAPGPAGEGNVREFSYGLEITVECNDYPLLWDPAAGVDERIAQLGAAATKLPRRFFAPFGRREYLLSSAAHLTNCLTWPAPPGGTEPPVPPGYVAPRSFPTLVLAGQVDDITSVAEAREVTQRFPRSRLYVVPDRGHASSLYYPFRSPAVGVIRRFIAAN